MPNPRWKVWNKSKEFLGDGTHFMVAGDLNCMLSTVSYADMASFDSIGAYADVSAGEVANGNGYATGGAAAGANWVRSGGITQLIALGSVLSSWVGSGAGFTAVSAILYHLGTNNGIVKPLVAVLSLDITKPAWYVGPGVTFRVLPETGTNVILSVSGATVN